MKFVYEVRLCLNSVLLAGEFACKFVYDSAREQLHRITDKRYSLYLLY